MNKILEELAIIRHEVGVIREDVNALKEANKKKLMITGTGLNESLEDWLNLKLISKPMSRDGQLWALPGDWKQGD